MNDFQFLINSVIVYYSVSGKITQLNEHSVGKPRLDSVNN